ncbi:sensor histidine kinase, partial [Crocinitomicaceae bacterium]|nr:sensor histidine kinase [Crocinitomicaceae bacterium]
MKNLKPFQILLAGGIIVMLVVFIVSAIVFHHLQPSLIVIFLFALFAGIITFVTFYFLIKRFITHRLKVLYRSIRKGKFESSQD